MIRLHQSYGSRQAATLLHTTERHVKALARCLGIKTRHLDSRREWEITGRDLMRLDYYRNPETLSPDSYIAAA